MAGKVGKRLRKVGQAWPMLAHILRALGVAGVGKPTRTTIQGVGNRIQCKRAVLDGVQIDIQGNDNVIEIGEKASLTGVRIFIKGDCHRLEIGPRCKFRGGGSLWFEDQACTIRIGEGSTFESVGLAVLEPGSTLRIGCDCMFSYDIDVRTSDSHSIVDASTGKRLNPARDIYFGDHVWVGAHTIVLKGAVVADHSVVAAGAVVTGQFEEQGVVIGGSPAKVLKRGISWDRKRL